jgi:hypothetical protein
MEVAPLEGGQGNGTSDGLLRQHTAVTDISTEEKKRKEMVRRLRRCTCLPGTRIRSRKHRGSTVAEGNIDFLPGSEKETGLWRLIMCSIRGFLVSTRISVRRRTSWWPSFIERWPVATTPWRPTVAFSVSVVHREGEERGGSVWGKEEGNARVCVKDKRGEVACGGAAPW